MILKAANKMSTYSRTVSCLKRLRFFVQNFLLIFVLISSSAFAKDGNEKFLKESNRLYRAYLEGDLEQAKRSMEDTIALIEKSKLDKSSEAHCLYLDYSRLFVIHEKAGNQALAEVLWVKIQYWKLRNSELLGLTGEELLEDVKRYTKEKCIAVVERFDEMSTGGKGPNYLKQLSK